MDCLKSRDETSTEIGHLMQHEGNDENEENVEVDDINELIYCDINLIEEKLHEENQQQKFVNENVVEKRDTGEKSLLVNYSLSTESSVNKTMTTTSASTCSPKSSIYSLVNTPYDVTYSISSTESTSKVLNSAQQTSFKSNSKRKEHNTQTQLIENGSKKVRAVDQDELITTIVPSPGVIATTPPIKSFLSFSNENESSNDAFQSSNSRSSKQKKQLPEIATKLMKDWWEKHLENPYPNEDERKKMANEGQIKEVQVKAWFANKRNRTNNTKSKTTPKKIHPTKVLTNELQSGEIVVERPQPQLQQKPVQFHNENPTLNEILNSSSAVLSIPNKVLNVQNQTVASTTKPKSRRNSKSISKSSNQTTTAAITICPNQNVSTEQSNHEEDIFSHDSYLKSVLTPNSMNDAVINNNLTNSNSKSSISSSLSSSSLTPSPVESKELLPNDWYFTNNLQDFYLNSANISKNIALNCFESFQPQNQQNYQQQQSMLQQQQQPDLDDIFSVDEYIDPTQENSNINNDMLDKKLFPFNQQKNPPTCYSLPNKLNITASAQAISTSLTSETSMLSLSPIDIGSSEFLPNTDSSNFYDNLRNNYNSNMNAAINNDNSLPFSLPTYSQHQQMQEQQEQQSLLQQQQQQELDDIFTVDEYIDPTQENSNTNNNNNNVNFSHDMLGINLFNINQLKNHTNCYSLPNMLSIPVSAQAISTSLTSDKSMLSKSPIDINSNTFLPNNDSSNFYGNLRNNYNSNINGTITNDSSLPFCLPTYSQHQQMQQQQQQQLQQIIQQEAGLPCMRIDQQQLNNPQISNFNNNIYFYEYQQDCYPDKADFNSIQNFHQIQQNQQYQTSQVITIPTHLTAPATSNYDDNFGITNWHAIKPNQIQSQQQSISHQQVNNLSSLISTQTPIPPITSIKQTSKLQLQYQQRNLLNTQNPRISYNELVNNLVLNENNVDQNNNSKQHYSNYEMEKWSLNSHPKLTSTLLNKKPITKTSVIRAKAVN